jgi:7-carboxy-7-deazaguanine synthase
MSSVIPYTEIFYSLQGEGKYIGTPSIFIRLWGCNLSCSGFSNPDKKDVIVSDHTSIEDIDEKDFHYGCDSRYSWHKDYKHLIKNATAKEIVDEMYKLLPSGDWVVNENPVHLIFTGGEPTLHQGGIVEILDEIYERSDVNDCVAPMGVTIETNASVELRSTLVHKIPTYVFTTFTWSNSPKLSHSGERLSHTVRPEVIAQQRIAGGERVYKFVVRATKEDFDEVNAAMEILEPFNGQAAIYVMPLGVTKEQIQENAAGVAKLCLEYGFRYSDRLQVTLFESQIGT